MSERLMQDLDYAKKELRQIADGHYATLDEARAAARATLVTLDLRRAFVNRDAALAEADRPDAVDRARPQGSDTQ